MLPLVRMAERVERARNDSDVSYFHDLLYFGELVVKLVGAGMTASLEDDKDRQRYRLEHGLVRSNGIGDWVTAIDDVLVGPASQQISKDARVEQRQLTERFHSKDEESWQERAVRTLHSGCLHLDSSYGALHGKVNLRTWFKDFVWLRNKSRGHGALSASQCSHLCTHLAESIDMIVAEFHLFSRSWAYLRRNISGKYRITAISGDCSEFEYLKSSTREAFADGVHVYFDEPRPVPLLITDLEVSDFFCPNGNFKEGRYELISYITGETIGTDGSVYSATPGDLPESETTGMGSLEPLGTVFSNLPALPEGYVTRPELEGELLRILSNDRHPVVTLVGRGGIGKTSLALKVLRDLAQATQFEAMVWFSARDIDLLTEGPKIVRPDVLSESEIAEQYVDLVQPREAADKGFQPTDFFATTLRKSAIGPTVFVFDNFETAKNPLDLFNWLDANIRLPNKILITTRGRDFRGDYHVEVRGMIESEFKELVQKNAARLGIERLLNPDYLNNLYLESGGHPYVVKVLLGEVADAGKLVRVPRLMAGREDILEALFDRTFSNLTPVAVRIFLTLSNWRSTVPRVALEAALLRPDNEHMDVELGLDQLIRSSMVEVTSSPEGEEFISTPLVAAIFGKRKLLVSPFKSAIDADMEMLRLIGAMTEAEVGFGLAPYVKRLFRNVTEIVETSSKGLDHFLPVIEYVARAFPPAWLHLADLYAEQMGSDGRSLEVTAIRHYLEARPDDLSAWSRLARAYSLEGDHRGEATAYVQRAIRPACPFYEVSFAANKVNSLIAQEKLRIDEAEMRALTKDLVEVMERRSGEAKATDYSRLAWLNLHRGDKNGALEWANKGLFLDAENEHCLRLRERLYG